MEMEVVHAPRYEIADRLEICDIVEKSDDLSGNFDKTRIDLMNNNDKVVELDLNGSNELYSDSFEMTLRQSSDEHSTSVIGDAIVSEPVKNNEIPQIELSKVIDAENTNDLVDADQQDSPIKITQRKRKTIIDSESENEVLDIKIQKPFKLIDSESEFSTSDVKTPEKTKLIDSDSRDSNASSMEADLGKKVKRLKKRKDHKTTNLAPPDSEEENEPDRKQHKDIVDRVDEKEMIAIKSESQRTIRDHVVEIPRHKPRTFTLKEFLERKTVVKPTALIKQQAKAFKSNGNIKMSREELKVFAKKIEQRKRDIRSFFKPQTVEKPAKKNVEAPATKTPEKVETITTIEPVFDLPDTPTVDVNKENINEVNTPVESTSVAEPEANTKKQEKIAQLSNLKSEVRLSFNYDENSFIDLESGSVVSKKVESKAEQYKNRVLKLMNAGKKKKSTDENEELKRLIDCDEEYKMDIKPRGSYIKLKKQLEERIMEEKKIKFKKQEQELENKDDEEEMEEYNEKLEEEEDEKEEQTEMFDEDEEAQNQDDDENDEDDDEEQDDVELDCSQEKSKMASEVEENEHNDEEDKAKTFSRIKLLEDLYSSDEDILPTVEEGNQLKLLEDDKLFSQDVADGRDVEDELLGLCSGRFDTQFPATIPLTMSSQAPTTCEGMASIPLSIEVNEANGVSGDEEEDKIGVKKVRKPQKIVISDDDEAGDPDDLNESHDDEEEVDDEEEPEEPDAQPTVYDDEEEEMIITYDSDENDIALTVDDYEKTKKMKIQNFIEKEAELSESDWNSEDEDEKGADNYDIELGDEDQFDAQKLKSELAQIHMRRMLNDDERQVQLIQDLILPDQEENETRERKFRWKNLDNPMAADGQQSAENPALNENASEDESEEYYRKLRFERETMLQSQPDDLDPASILIRSDSQDLDKPKVFTKRLSIIKTDRNKTPNTSTETSFLIGSKNSPLITKFRDSFLARGEEHLSSLGQLTIEKLEKCEAIETAITTEKSAKLFFVIDEEAKAKRKCDETLESSFKRKKIS